MAQRIQPGWRYTLAQCVLGLLFGRKWHYISPWPKSGVAVCTIIVRNKQVLLCQRKGNIEHAGAWSNIGGYLELQLHESFAQAAVREFYEETGFQLPLNQFPLSPDMVFLSHDQPKFSEAKATATVGYYLFTIVQDIIPLLKPQEETAAFQWFTEEQVQQMIATGLIPADFTDLHAALAEIFARLKNGESFRKLKLPA